jgi:hypothetical protein
MVSHRILAPRHDIVEPASLYPEPDSPTPELDTPSSVSAAVEISIQHCVIPDRSESRSHVTDADTLGMYFNPSYWRYIFEEHAAGVS